MFLWSANIKLSVQKDRVVLLDLGIQQFFCLDGLYALICEKMVSKQFTIDDIITELEGYQCEEDLKKMVEKCIDDMKGRRWVIECEI